MSTAAQAPVRLALEARAIGRPVSADDSTRTIEARIYSGEAVRRNDVYGNSYDLVLDPAGLDSSRVTAGSCPLIDSHSTYSIGLQLGSVVAVWTVGREIFARFQVSPRPEVDGVWQDLKAGTARGVSMGLILIEWSDELGDNGVVAKRTATKWQIYEVSLVTVPADSRAVTLSFDKELNMQIQNNSAAATAPVQLSVEQADDVRDRVRLAQLPAEFAESLINGGKHGKDATAAIFEELARRSEATRIIPHAAFTRDYSEGRIERMVEGLSARLTGKTPTEAGREYAGKRMADLARECLAMRSRLDTHASDARVIELAMTTSDFPNLLTGTGQRMLLDAYQAAQPAIKQIARRGTALDYRPKNVLQLSQTPSLEKVNEDGEVEHGAMAESKQSYSVEDYARIVALSNKAVANDDLSAFSDFARKFGVSAAQREAQLLVDLLTANSGAGPVMSDSANLFHANHKNIATQAAIAVNSLSEARKLMRAQTDLDKTTIVNVEPRYLVVPAALETTGEQILASIAATKLGDVNPFSQRLVLIVEPRLDAKSLTRYYLFGEPSVAPVLEISYLANAEGPQVSSRVGFEKLGIEFRCVLTVGVGAVDHRGAVTNAG